MFMSVGYPSRYRQANIRWRLSAVHDQAGARTALRRSAHYGVVSGERAGFWSSSAGGAPYSWSA